MGNFSSRHLSLEAGIAWTVPSLRWGPGDQRIGIRFLAGARDLCLLQNVPVGGGAQPTFDSVSIWNPISGVKHPGREAGKSPSSSAHINTFAASYLNTQGLNNSCLKSPAWTLVDLTFQSRALRSFSLNQLRNLSL